jgi:hypothetical protein
MPDDSRFEVPIKVEHPNIVSQAFFIGVK